MKIAYYSPSWPPGATPNGIVTYLSQIIPVLRRRGHDVVVLTPAAGPQVETGTIDLQNYKRSFSLRDKLKFKIWPNTAQFEFAAGRIVDAVTDLIQHERIEILEMEESFGWSKAVADLRLIPVVVRLHGPWFLNKRFEDQRREAREARGIETASFVTSPSQAVLEATLQRIDFPRENAVTIHNPLAVPNDKWDISNCDGIRLLYVGRFDKIKGGDTVLHAFRRLAEINPNVQLTFIGPDDGIPDGKVVPTGFWEYAKATLPANVLSRVTYLGALSFAEVQRLRMSHFLTMSASRFEVFPYAVLEAMSYGCPIVAPRVGGIPELISDSKNGLLFGGDSASELASACQRLIDNQKFAVTLGRAARQTCIARFDPEQVTDKIIETYKGVLETRAGPTM